jgi:hypothetical protein
MVGRKKVQLGIDFPFGDIFFLWGYLHFMGTGFYTASDGIMQAACMFVRWWQIN